MKTIHKIGITLALVLVVILGSFMWINNYNVKSAHLKRTGINLDTARLYYSPATIENYINTIHAQKGNYIQLHLSDNENYGLESSTLNQTTQNAYVKNGAYYNKQTDQPFLSKAQLQSIIDYGKKQGVQVVPEIDLPGHSGAILRLLSYQPQYKNLVNEIQHSPQEMYYQKEATLDISKKILSEYTGMVPQGSYFSTGGDEISIVTNSDQEAIRKYDNNLDDFLNSKGLNMEMWNDSVMNRELKNYNKNILVNYWSQSGESADPATNADHIKKRAPMPAINDAGIKTINNNYNYTYLIMDPHKLSSEQVAKYKQKLTTFHPTMWNMGPKDKANSKNNIGVGLSVWNESPSAYSDKQTYHKALPLIKQFFVQIHKT